MTAKHTKSKYVFRPYDPIHPEYFSKEKDRLKKFIGEAVLIEHIGSTSIPGMGGKGIIDIAVAANSKNDLSNVSSKLIAAGYYFDPDDGTDERWFHGRKVSDEERYHIHLTFKGSKDWIEITSFRDYLITHPEDFERYAEIKMKAAKLSNQDAKTYMKIKEPVILEIIGKATKK
ncbi:TPA: hypothetical protein DD690_00125 [Candidatus Daviesbacteria bacterium]|nr:hypothetical protein [Candidatus Daviesbacteria bacterium]